jgi:hypothetical protein
MPVDADIPDHKAEAESIDDVDREDIDALAEGQSRRIRSAGGHRQIGAKLVIFVRVSGCRVVEKDVVVVVESQI